MISPFGWSALAVLLLYLTLFFWGGAMAARTAGRSIWLIGQATGRDWLAAVGFRAAFGLAIHIWYYSSRRKAHRKPAYFPGA